MNRPFIIHQRVQIIAGKLAGLVGVVEDITGEGGRARYRVRVQGVAEGEPIDATVSLPASSLEFAE